MVELSLIIASFVAGFLTVLAPCQLVFLPVIIGGSLSDTERNPYRIIGSLLLSIIIFTLIIRGLALVLFIPNEIWIYIAGVLVLAVGVTFLIPSLWTRLPFISRTSGITQKIIGSNMQRTGLWSDVAIGAALGPAFSSCSPTFLLILTLVLSVQFLEGVLYLIIFLLGLGVMLLFIALLGQTFANRLLSVADAQGWFKRTMGILIILVGLAILTGFDKVIEEKVLDLGFITGEQLELPFTINRQD